ncbi:MAG: GNAT family N-acyltransferase [Rhizobiaceae bacterium]|nr:GNAT family N-acyltransferase [Rhizobiaceae bacterium]
MSTSEIQAQGQKSDHYISGRLGTFETRLAITTDEVEMAQALRYRVFCDELDAEKTEDRDRLKLEADSHDSRCDHLLIFSRRTNGENILVGTQRFMVRKGEVGPSEFYSSSEFDVSGMLEKHSEKRFMELGRSCILPEFRDKRTMELLWHGTWDYALKQGADVMFGCASFPTLNVSQISEALGFLVEHAPLAEDWQVTSKRPDRIDMRQFTSEQGSPKSAIRILPPLIKGYLRLGAMFSSDAVPDTDFGTIDVLVVLPVESINPRYVKYYGATAERHRG